MTDSKPPRKEPFLRGLHPHGDPPSAELHPDSKPPQTFEEWYRQYRPYWDGNRNAAEYEACHIAFAAGVASQQERESTHREAVAAAFRAGLSAGVASRQAEIERLKATLDLTDATNQEHHRSLIRYEAVVEAARHLIAFPNKDIIPWTEWQDLRAVFAKLEETP